MYNMYIHSFVAARPLIILYRLTHRHRHAYIIREQECDGNSSVIQNNLQPVVRTPIYIY